MEPVVYEKRGYLFEDFRLFHLRDTQMQPVDWHYHSFHKLIFFLSGQAHYDIEGQRYTLEPGDLLLVGRGDIHRPEISADAPYERVIVYLSPEFLSAHSSDDCLLEQCFLTARAQFRFVLRPAGHTNPLLPVLSALERAVSEEGFGQALLCRSLFLQLMVEVNRAIADSTFSYAADAVYDEKILAILQYLNTHLTEPIRIDALASRFFISKFYMMRRFRAETGYTIHNYLVSKRLLLAKEYIAGGATITDACYRCGFQDYSTFSRAFKKQFGHTPKQNKP